MNIVVAGGSGYVGEKILKRLSKDYLINLSKTRKSTFANNNILIDLNFSHNIIFDKQIDLLINAIDVDYIDNNETLKVIVKNLVDFAKLNNIKKIIHLSDLNRDDLSNAYQKGKLIAENIVENSHLDYIIFRTSFIFGDGSYLNRFIQKFSTSKIIPIIGSLENKFAPIYIEDLIDNIEYAINSTNNWNSDYDLCGPEYLSIKDLFLRYSSKKIKFVKFPKILTNLLINQKCDSFSKKAAFMINSFNYKDNSIKKLSLVQPLTFY